MSKSWIRCSREINVVDKRAEPGEKRAGISTLVRRRSDHPVEFAVHLDDPNEEITEQWQDGLHEWYIRRDDQCSVKPNRIPVMSPRCEASLDSVPVSNAGPSPSAQTVKYRRHVNVTPTVTSRGPVAVLPQKPSCVAWFQRCFCVPHLFGLPSSRKVDSANRTHIPTISGIAANGSGVVDKIAKTTRMMCWYLLMVGITFWSGPCCACAAWSRCLSGTDVTIWSSVFREGFDLVQVGGQVTDPEDRDTAVRLRGYKIRHVQPHRLANSVRSSEVVSKAGRVLETDYSQVGRAEQEITISSGVCCRLGSGPASSWWKSVSDVSMEMERADDLANSICDQ